VADGALHVSIVPQGLAAGSIALGVANVFGWVSALASS
jgi:hypothetical protein